MPTTFRRKNIRLPRQNYRGEQLCFLTLCFDQRRSFGTDDAVAAMLVEQLRTVTAAKSFLVHAFCIMPDHLHALVAGTSQTSDVLELVNGYKQRTGYEFRRTTGQRLWQFKYYDHILRRTDRAEAVAWYIWLNPVRKGICKHPLDYRHAGSFTEAGMRMRQSLMHEDWIPPWKATSHARTAEQR